MVDAFMYPDGVLPVELALRKALQWWRRVLFDALNGQPWDTVLPKFGQVQWPPEEAVRLIVSHELGLVPQDAETWAREVVWYGRKGGQQRKEKEAA